MVKEQFRETDVARKILGVEFVSGSGADIKKAAHIPVLTKELYTNEPGQWNPATYGSLDRRLGTCQKGGVVCKTCEEPLSDCVGHFGYVDLALPVFHIGYFKQLIQLLKCICKQCSRCLLPLEKRKEFLGKIRRPTLTYLERKAVHKKLVEVCGKSLVCPFCGYKNGMVKKAVGAVLKIVHDVKGPSSRSKEAADVMSSMLIPFTEAIKFNKELETMVPKWKLDLLNPIIVWDLLQRIPLEDASIVMCRSECQNPTNLLLIRIPVPPVAIRPSVLSEVKSNSTEDDITMKIAAIITLNDCINIHKKEGARMEQVTEDWDYLQVQCALYINSELTGLPLKMQQKKSCRSFAQRLKGKHGRFRGNLSGKRVDFSGRTVISPDPHLRIDQVGVPELVAKILTYPERVTKSNMEDMKKLVRNGADTHPGANFIVEKSTNTKKFLKYGNRKMISETLKYGDIIERHLRNDDIVLFNRQPSLHRISIMAHRAKVLPWRTFRFNECACTPYNADFDGDEMNLHLPQTEEAKAEAATLMGVKGNLVTPRSGEPLVAAIQDFITAGYLITHMDQFFTKVQLCRIISAILDTKDLGDRIELPPPAIWKPKQLWTGKQVFSLILKPNRWSNTNLNIRAKGKNYTKGEELCTNDSFVTIRNGVIMTGQMDKSTLGSGSKTNVFYILMRDFGEDVAITAMWRLGRIAPAFLSNHGFSIGIGDVKPGQGLLTEKKALCNDGYRNCLNFIQMLKEGDLKADPGVSPEETLEAKLLSELSTIRDKAGKSCRTHLSRHNAPLIMALCGSKGSFINISQMVACVGQQSISGKRPADGFEMRSLPHFARNQKTPEAKGFVENSFYSGLTPTEFIFHTMAGREGLVDTAVKTAETGYMQRRLVKCLEDLCAHYDNTVRSSVKDVVQFIFGEDGLDPALMEAKDGSVLDLNHLMEHVVNTTPSGGLDDHLSEENMQVLLESTLKEGQYIKDVAEPYKKVCHDFLWTRLKRTFHYFEMDQQCAKHQMTGKGASKCLECKRIRNLRERLIRTCSLSSQQIGKFLETCGLRYRGAMTEPGTAVGAVAATSIGEPSTQMTLKTFHFAGVASMNITQGVPRIKEIINAVKNISTPIVKAPLTDERDPEFARRVKARIEKTTLGEICEYMEDVYLADDSFVLLKISRERIKLLQLEVTMDSIAESICTAKASIIPSPGIKMHNIQVLSRSIMLIRVSDSTKHTKYHTMQNLKLSLQRVVVKGIPSVNRCLIHADEKTGETYILYVEGSDFLQVMATPGIDAKRTRFNNALDVAKVLGIEAARKVIIDEILETMAGHGIALDRRHVMLLAELMTYKGEVLGITRTGLPKMKDSVLMLASFERTIDHLFEASFLAQQDDVCGVSECIILGMQMNVGTGVFHLLQNSSTNRWKRKILQKMLAENSKKVPLLDDGFKFLGDGLKPRSSRPIPVS